VSNIWHGELPSYLAHFIANRTTAHMLSHPDCHRRSVLPMARAVRSAIATAVAVATLLAGCSSSGPAAEVARSNSASSGPDTVGATIFASSGRQHAPPLRGRTLNGQPFALAKVLGKATIVLNVWASWCVQCRTEAHGLKALSDAMAGHGVRFVGIDEQDTLTRARAFVKATHASYPHLVDPNGTLLAQLRLLPTAGIPSTLVIDRHGLMAGRIVGVAHEAVLRHMIDQIVAGS
jgi:peroxiredoxin